MVILSLILAFIFLSAPTDMYGATSNVEIVEVTLSQEELTLNETLIVKIQVLAKDPRLESQTLNIETKLFKNLGQVSFARKLSLSNNEVHQLQYYEYALKPLRIGFETIRIRINDQNFGPYSVTIRSASSPHAGKTSQAAHPNDPANSNLATNNSSADLSTNNSLSDQSASKKTKESSSTNIHAATDFFAEVHLEKSELYLNELSRYSLVLYSTEKFSQISFPQPPLPTAPGMSLIPIDPGNTNRNSQSYSNSHSNNNNNNNSQQAKTRQDDPLAQQDSIVHRNGKDYFSQKILEYALYPIRTGKLEIDHGDLEVRYAGETLSRPPRTKTIVIPPAKVTALAYPHPNPPSHNETANHKNFSNQYGDFRIRLINAVPPTARVGEALEITLRIEGSGNFKTLIFPDWEGAIQTMSLSAPPPTPNGDDTVKDHPTLSSKDISIYRSRRKDNYTYESDTFHGLSDVTYTLFAQKPGALKLPPIIFSAFSPLHQRIDTQEILLPLIIFSENTLATSAEAPLPLNAIPPPPLNSLDSLSSLEELNNNHRLEEGATAKNTDIDTNIDTNIDITQDAGSATHGSALNIGDETTATLNTEDLGDKAIQFGSAEGTAASAQSPSRTLRTVLLLIVFILALVLVFAFSTVVFPRISRKWRQKWHKSHPLSKNPRRPSARSVSLGEEEGLTLRATGLVLSSGSSIREIVRQTQRQLNPSAALMRDPSLHAQTISHAIAGTLVSNIPIYIEKLLTEITQQAKDLPASLQNKQTKNPAPPKSIRNLRTHLDSLKQPEEQKSFLLSPKHIAVLKQLIELVIHAEHQWVAPPPTQAPHATSKNALSTKKQGASTKKSRQVTGKEDRLLSLQEKETPLTSDILISQQKMALRLLRQSERMRTIRRLQLGLENLYAKSFLKWRMQLRRSLRLG